MPIRSAVTVSLVAEARGGPFVFWDGLEEACTLAARLGFDGVEIFPPAAEVFERLSIGQTLTRHGLQLAAVGTGAGWVKHRLRLTDPDESVRARAVEFVKSILESAATLHAPVIIGSMQGKFEGGVTRAQSLEWLAESMSILDRAARELGTRLLIEPLNRYETNLLNTVGHSIEFIQFAGLTRTGILADLFHMNIEESDTPEALRCAGPLLGHVHFADSNRRAMGFGQTDGGLVARTLRSMGYAGYVSAEVFPHPDPRTAAAQTAAQFQALFVNC